MTKYCKKCKCEYFGEKEKCPACGEKLEERLAEQERLDRENEDFTVINMLLL